MATFRTNKTKTTKPALRRMKGYSATLKSKVGDTQTVTYVVTHPDGQETTHVTHHGQARHAFWEIPIPGEFGQLGRAQVD